MDTFNLNQIENELRLKKSITDKLDYWKSIMDKYFNEPLTEQFGEYEYTLKQERAKRDKLTNLFGNDYSTITPLLIPEHIYNEHFENGLKTPELTYWFLNYNAVNYFEITKKYKELPELLDSDVSLLTIKRELKRINDFEQKAETLYIENKFNFRNSYSYSEYAEEIEYMRIKQGYYKDHVLFGITGIDLPTQMYAEHICLKNYLERELQKNEPQNTNTKQIKGFESKLSDEKIKSLFEQMQDIYFHSSLENFKAIFKPELLNYKPITRTKKFTDTLLIYFASELFQKENQNDYVSITEYCFNAENLSQSQNNYIQYNKNQKPKGYQEIDKIIQSL